MIAPCHRPGFSFPSGDGPQIAAYRWNPGSVPVAAVQITHGMGEHAQRYDHVARTMTEHGLVVYAQDQRGHGATADPERLGVMGAGG